MNTEFVNHAVTKIIHHGATIDALMGTLLASFLRPENEQKAIFLDVIVIQPMMSKQRNEHLNEYLKFFRPTFWEQHKKLFQDDLLKLREVRNKCAHRLLNVTMEQGFASTDEAFSFHGKRTLKDIDPVPFVIDQEVLNEMDRIYHEFTSLVINDMFLMLDEV